MIQKQKYFILSNCSKINTNFNNNQHKIIRTASGNILIEPGSEKAKIVEAEIKKHPNALFFRSKAIEADVPNNNGDCFSRDELIKACKTFEGVPFFTNHDNQNIENARGKVIFAEWIDEENAIYTISFIDRDAYPHICRSIEEEYVTGVSMGASVEYSVCSICGNVAETTDDYCAHIKNRKGRKFTGTARNVITGEVQHFKDAPVFEHNHGIKFIELSAVVDPACPDCKIQGIIPNGEFLKKVANVENQYRMIKTAALEKNASQEELDTINNCLDELEGISVNLIKNRKKVEPAFASELVDIISNLQEWADELTAAGYANFEAETSEEEMGDGDLGDLGEEGDQLAEDLEGAEGLEGLGDLTTEDQPLDGQAQAPAVQPVAQEEDLAGEVRGVSPSPQMPSLPISKPVGPTASNESFKQVTASLEKLKGIIETGRNMSSKRRTKSARKEQKNKTVEILSNSWKEKQEFFQYMRKVPTVQNDQGIVSVAKRDNSLIIVAESNRDIDDVKVWTYEDLSESQKQLIAKDPESAANSFLNTFTKIEGATSMSKINKEAGAKSVNANPDVVQEKQLQDHKDLYHSRQENELHQTTQAQLDAKRKGEKDYLTEGQLDDPELQLNKRQNESREVITEAQFGGENDSVSPRKGEDKHQITQVQLEGNRADDEPEVITEVQLNNIDAAWKRFANKDESLFKSASDHMADVVNASAKCVIASGCTPDELLDVVEDLVGTTKDKINFAVSLGQEPKDNEIDFGKRLAFWKNKNIKVAGSDKRDLAEMFVNKIRKIASDESINPEVVLSAVEVLSETRPYDVISEEIDSILEKEEKENVKVSKNVKDELRSALSTKASRDERRKKILKEANKIEKIETKASLKKDKEENKILNKKASLNSDYIIETDFDEIKFNKKEKDSKKKELKSTLKSFANKAMATQNLKVASITNVTISGDTIQIAVQTDTGSESVNIPLGDATEGTEPALDETIPEGDMTGEGAGEILEPMASSKKRTVTASKKLQNAKKKGLAKKAQSPMGGGDPIAEDAGAMPAGDVGAPEVGGLTGGEAEEVSDEVPSAVEKAPAWCVCPISGSTDVDVEVMEDGSIKGVCNDSGVEFEALMKMNVEYKILNPTQVGKEEEGVAEEPEAPEAPEVPALPVAAQINLDKKSLVKVASGLKQNGHVCPSCGHKHCEASVDNAGHVEYSCPSCSTQVTKDILVSKSNPEKSVLRVAWDLFPDINSKDCVDCKGEAIRLASKIKAEKLLKTASSKKNEFPTSSCIERLARQYGGDAVSTFGPCKGKLLAECVCGELQKLGFRTVGAMKRIAQASLLTDPMDECIEDQVKSGVEQKDAEEVCSCLKDKFSSKEDDSFLVTAFAKDLNEGKAPLTKDEFLAVEELIEAENKAQKIKIAKLEKEAQMMEDMQDIGDLPEIEEAEFEFGPEEVEEVEDIDDEEVAIVVDKDTAQEVCDSIREALGEEGETEEVEEVSEISEEVAPETVIEDDTENLEQIEQDKELALAMRMTKIRRSGEDSSLKIEQANQKAKPELLESIEGEVEAGVPRKDARIRTEPKIEAKKPSVPRGDATMGHEGKDNIDVDARDPEYPVNTQYIGDEANVQKDMPKIKNKTKGTVIAKKLKEVDTVEPNVRAGVPRSDATMGNEGKDNIDVEMKDPDVPRSNATMGNEGKDNIDVSIDGPDVPVSKDAYKGQEKSAPGQEEPNNHEILKQVKQNSDRDGQLSKIAQARKNEALQTASWLAANGRIDAFDRETFDSVVEALSGFSVDKIASVADKMFPMQKKASKVSDKKAEGYSIPAISQSSNESNSNDDFTKKLSDSIDHWKGKFD